MRRWIVALTWILVVGPGGAGAQETARERAQAALPATVFQEIAALATEAGRQGIPEEALYNKALEGIAKRVPADRLLPAVNVYAGRLREAQGAFGALANPPLIVAGADAIQRGVEAETLRRLGQGRGEGQPEEAGPTPVAVLVLADLVEAGVPADRALDVLHEALRLRTRDQQMLGISGQVRRLMRQGQSPQEAAEQVRRALMRGRGGGGVGPPVPPGSEPSTPGRRQQGKGRGGGGGG